MATRGCGAKHGLSGSPPQTLRLLASTLRTGLLILSTLPNPTVQRTGTSRFTQRQTGHHRRLAPVADLRVMRKLIDILPLLLVGCAQPKTVTRTELDQLKLQRQEPKVTCATTLEAKTAITTFIMMTWGTLPRIFELRRVSFHGRILSR